MPAMQNDNIITATEHILSQRNYPRQPSYLPAAIEDIHARFGQIPTASREVLREYFGVAELPEGLIESLFHKHTETVHSVTVCAGPICVQAGSDALATAVEGSAAVERSYCMGNCHVAPCAKVGKKFIAPATAESISDALSGNLRLDPAGD